MAIIRDLDAAGHTLLTLPLKLRLGINGELLSVVDRSITARTYGWHTVLALPMGQPSLRDERIVDLMTRHGHGDFVRLRQRIDAEYLRGR